MGVAGSGKSAVGRALAALYHASFLEGDGFHPGKNLRKMRDGHALSDDDRAPDYAALRSRLLDAATAGDGVVLASSALRAKHRALRNVPSSGVRFVHLIAQLATLEPPTEVNTVNVFVDARDSLSDLAARCFEALEVRG